MFPFPLQRKIITSEELNKLRKKLRDAFAISKGEELLTPNNKSSPYYYSLKIDILEKAKEEISEGTLLKFFHDDKNRKYQIKKIETIKKYIDQCIPHETSKNQIITLQNWTASTNVSTPQWADYLKVPIEGGFIKRIRCQIKTTSQYYRFGFKLFRKNGKLFGDGSIQSMDNNFVIHVGKNFLENDLFITPYQNGIRLLSDIYPNTKPLKNKFSVELSINEENFLFFFLNDKEVFKAMINKAIREQIYMLAWGDGNKYRLRSEHIEIEFGSE